MPTYWIEEQISGDRKCITARTVQQAVKQFIDKQGELAQDNDSYNWEIEVTRLRPRRHTYLAKPFRRKP